MSDKKQEATVRIHKVRVNRLLKRKQFLVEVVHHGRSGVPNAELREKIAKMYKSDPLQIVLYGMRTKFGGGYSNGFGILYDDITSLKETEPKYTQARLGLVTRTTDSRKQRKERKNRAKKLKGTKKASVPTGKK